MRFMKLVAILVLIVHTESTSAQVSEFNKDKDLLLAQFDCKTDVDDLHTVAALATLLTHDTFRDINYHAVAGTYGIQDGLYVPANDLFELAFGNQWSDAHSNSNGAMKEVLKRVNDILISGGDVWVAEAGQSDFSARWVDAISVMQPSLDLKSRIHVVQHSDWNEEVTDPELLEFVKSKVDYHKIPDGNAVGNGTPGFRSDAAIEWKVYLKEAPELLAIWQKAITIGDTYNGKENRYLNESIAKGGLDFSDLSETCYILGIQQLKDADAFFQMFK